MVAGFHPCERSHKGFVDSVVGRPVIDQAAHSVRPDAHGAAWAAPRAPEKERPKGLSTDDSIRLELVGALKLPECPFGAHSEVAVDRQDGPELSEAVLKD